MDLCVFFKATTTPDNTPFRIRQPHLSHVERYSLGWWFAVINLTWTPWDPWYIYGIFTYISLIFMVNVGTSPKFKMEPKHDGSYIIFLLFQGAILRFLVTCTTLERLPADFLAVRKKNPNLWQNNSNCYPPWNKQLAPENRPKPKNTIHLPTIDFQWRAVFFREGIILRLRIKKSPEKSWKVPPCPAGCSLRKWNFASAGYFF